MESFTKLHRHALVAAFALGIGAALMAGGVGGQPIDYSVRQSAWPVGTSTPTTPKFQIEFEPSARWIGPVRWKYNHANAPPEFEGAKVAIIARLQASFNQWTSQCGATHQYEGETTTLPNTLVGNASSGDQPDGISVVGWDSLEPAFGAWTHVWYALSGTQRVLVDADIVLSDTSIKTLETLNRLITHEWGHALGLAHSNLDNTLMAGPPLTSYSPLVTPQADDIRGCRCLYGLPPGVSSSYVCSLPPAVDFGDAIVDMTSPPQSVTFTNSGNASLSIQTAEVLDRIRFHLVDGCGPGSLVGPGESCTVALTTSPTAAGTVKSRLALFTSEGFYELPLVVNGVEAGTIAPTVGMIEYFNVTLDHYFITWAADEIANLDAGTTSPPWTRTGKSFKAFAAAQSGTSPVCRFYIPPALGNSHFFGRGATECDATRVAHPDFVLEDPDFMQLFVPNGGECPAGAKPLYRVFNNRAATNHRYTSERTVRDEMVGKGWIAEGDGADVVTMCTP